MQEFTYDERTCLACRFEYLTTLRRLMFYYGTYSRRTIYVEYTKLYSSKRSLHTLANPVISERQIFLPGRHHKYYSHRMCVTGYADSPGDFRYIWYLPGNKKIICTVRTQLPLRYRSDRITLACNGGMSQKIIIFVYTVSSTRYIIFRRVEQVRVYTGKTQLSIIAAGERKITLHVGFMTDRAITLVYVVPSERYIQYRTTNMGMVHSPRIYLGMERLSSYRCILVGGGAAISERYMFMLVNLYSERGIGLHYRAPSERYIATSVFRTKRMHTPKIIPASIRNTARFVLFNAISNDSERYIFLETRELYISKSPILSSPLVSIRKNEDSFSSYKLVNDRNIEYHGVSDVDNIQRQDSINTTKLIIQGRDDINLTAVDNKGSMITLNGVNIKKILKFSFRSILNLIK